MLDFTSALYLGLRHPSGSLWPWSQFTTGRPAALAIPASQERVAEALAELQGCERATLGPSHPSDKLRAFIPSMNQEVYLCGQHQTGTR